MFQKKKQDKTLEKLSEEEIGNLPNKEFKVMTVKVIKKLGRRMDKQSEKLDIFNKELEYIKSNQRKMNNIVTEMKIH